MRKLFKAIAILFCLGIVMAAAGSVYAWRWLHQPLADTEAVTFEVRRGAPVSRIAMDLQRAGWIQHPHLWTTWARYQQVSNRIKAGEYALTPGMTPQQLLDLFASGNVVLRSLTVVEGSTFADLKRALANRADITHETVSLSDAELMRMLGAPGVHPEAQFFPDTYQFAKGSSDLDILRRAQQRMQRELAAVWQTRDPELILENPYEALILASIVEKETALASERPVIAGVFLERLARGMRLQTDPTVIYGLGSDFDGDLRKADLLRDSPYNTYTRSGLPPTPICLPGAAALRAAVNPQRTGALFFVASGKGDGSHQFSSNLNDHNAAVRRYLGQLRSR